MEFWEFLIQKEGDRSWLPLESPSVEILAGRYRVVARSSRANLATEVRVTHYAVTEQPPVRRIRKRSSQTNADGLIVILPFTRLQPGLWELRCTGDLMAEMMGENWRYTVQLEVVTETAALPEPSAPEPEIPATTVAEGNEIDAPATTIPAAITAAIAESSETAELAEVAAPAELSPELPVELTDPILAPVDAALVDAMEVPTADSIEVAEQQDIERATPELAQPAVSNPGLAEVLQQIEEQSEQMVSAAFQELALEDLLEDPEGESTSDVAPTTALSLPQLQVVLEQETYIIQRGEVVALAGRIEYLDPTDAISQAQRLSVSELRVRLYDPQTSEMLMDEVYPIDNRMLPFPFSGTVSLPEHYQTYLVLGELIFQGSAGGSEPQVLARQSFNVTTDLHELMESIANDFPDVEALPPEAQIPVIAEPLPAVELERLAQPKFQRSTQSLPPQLRQPNPTRTHASLELPTFVKPVQPDVKPEVSQPPTASTGNEQNQVEQISTSAADLEPLEVSLPIPAAATATGSSDALNSANQTADGSSTDNSGAADNTTERATNSTADLFPDWDEIRGRVPIWKQRQQRRPSTSNAPEDESFRALNLQDRFWTRLQSLATNPNLSATLGTPAELMGNDGTQTADMGLAPLAHVAELATRKRQIAGLDADLTAHEIVVEDEPPPVVAKPLETEPEISEADLSLSPILPEDEPIPTPRLQLPTGELTADQPIQLTVKLPNLLARVYVKLWLRDRQTRELLGTPRWIIDFVPDGFGNQMARTEITVPPGCLKVQFEAIAVEIATQRESDKTTMTRPVVPPDLSPFSLDKLEI